MRATEDRDLWLRIAQRYEVGVAPEVVAYYRISPQGMTTDADRMLQAQIRFVNKHFGTPFCGRRERRVALSLIYRQRAETLSDKVGQRQAIASALRAFTYWPFQKATVRTLAAVTLRGAGFLRGRRFDPNR